MPQDQQTISSYFAAKKRRSGVIDLTKIDDTADFDERHTKRLRTSGPDDLAENKNQSHTSKSPVPDSQVPSLNSWAFIPNSSLSISTEAGPKNIPLSRNKSALRERLPHRSPTSWLHDQSEKDSELDEIEPEPATPQKTSRSRSAKNKAPIGPQGIPCTPLEEVVSDSQRFRLITVSF